MIKPQNYARAVARSIGLKRMLQMQEFGNDYRPEPRFIGPL